MDKQELKEQTKKLREAKLLFDNIIEGGENKRFNFTEKEKESLQIISQVLLGNLESMREELTEK